MSEFHTITPDSVEWPALLVELPEQDQPTMLWVRGEASLAELTESSVAIMGAWAATSYGTFVASDLAYGLAKRGVTTVSGGAFGIETAAHRGALAARPDEDTAALTVVVLPCAIDSPYPQGHAHLLDDVVQAGGLVITAFEPGSPTSRSRITRRDRLIAGLTHGMVLVESDGEGSNSASVLSYVRELGRVRMAVPGPITSAMSAGPHDQLRKPGTVLVARVEHVLAATGL